MERWANDILIWWSLGQIEYVGGGQSQLGDVLKHLGGISCIHKIYCEEERHKVQTSLSNRCNHTIFQCSTAALASKELFERNFNWFLCLKNDNSARSLS